VVVVLGLGPDVLQLAGTTLKTLSPVLAVPFRTRTGHFAGGADVVPVVAVEAFLRRRPPQALLRGETSAGQARYARGLRAGGQVAVRLGHVGRVLQQQLLGGRPAAHLAHGGAAGGGRHLAHRLSDGYFFEFDGLHAGGEVAFFSRRRDRLLQPPPSTPDLDGARHTFRAEVRYHAFSRTSRSIRTPGGNGKRVATEGDDIQGGSRPSQRTKFNVFNETALDYQWP
jgi:hypothetical protein